MSTLKIPKYKNLDYSKQYSKKQEKKLAIKVSGRVTAGSGNKLEKGDVRGSLLRIEAKCTKNKSFSITLEMLDKIKEAALSASPSETPCMQITFLKDEKVIEEILVMPLSFIDTLIKNYEPIK